MGCTKTSGMSFLAHDHSLLTGTLEYPVCLVHVYQWWRRVFLSPRDTINTQPVNS